MESDTSGMDVRELFTILYRYKQSIAVLCLSAIATATVMTYVLSERYRSVAMVMIRPQKTPTMVPQREQMLDFPVSYFTPLEQTSKTYTEIIKSRVIAQRIVSSLGVGALSAPPSQPGWLRRCKLGVRTLFAKTWTLLLYGRIEHEDSESSAVKEVQKSLTVKPTKETFLFEIQAEARTSELASRIANTAARVFTDYLHELAERRREGGRKSREEMKRQIREEFEQRQRDVVDYKERSGTISPKKESDLALEELAALERSRTDLDKRINGTKAKRAELTTQLSQCAKFTRTQTKEADNPVYVDLNLQLEKKEVNLVGLLKKFTREHQEVKVLQSEIDEIKARMGTQKPVRQSEETVAVDPVYEALAVEQARSIAELEVLKAEETRILSGIQDKKTQIAQLPRKEVELARLEVLAELSQESFMLISKHIEEMGLTAALDIPAIEVVQDGAVPLYPARPIKIYDAALAGILSLLLGIGLALVAENLNSMIRTVNEAEEAFSSPVLATVPTWETLLESKHLSDVSEPSSGGASQEPHFVNTAVPPELYSRLPANCRQQINSLKAEVLMYGQQGLSSFLVTSCTPGEGKSAITVMLAASLSECGQRVLVIDTHLTAPVLHQLFGVPRSPGLTDILTGLSASPPHPARLVRPGRGVLHLITAGSDGTDGFVSREALARLVEHFRTDYDYVLLDAASLLTGPETALTALAANVTLLVISAGTTSRKEAARARKMLERARAATVGIVMNHWSEPFGRS